MSKIQFISGSHAHDSWVPTLGLALVGLIGGSWCGSVHAQEAADSVHVNGGLAQAELSNTLPDASIVGQSEDASDNADVSPAAVGTGMLPASVTAGAIDPNGKVPAFNAVAGSGVSNLDVSFPLTVLTHGVSYCVTVTFQDYNITGDYKVDYYITQVVGGVTKRLVDQTIVTGKSSAPGDEWSWSINTKELPDSPGVATLVGRVRWGTNYSTQATVSSKIVIQ